MAKVAVKKTFGYAKNESINPDPLQQSIIDGLVALANWRIGELNDLTLKEFCARIDKISRSIERHNTFCVRGYLDFITEHIPAGSTLDGSEDV